MVNLIFISLACAFIAHVVTLQNGPVFVFSWFRKAVGVWAAKKSMEYGTLLNSSSDAIIKNEKLLRLKGNLVRSLGELVNCPYCLGPWLVLVGVAIFATPTDALGGANDNLLVNWLAGSGMLYVWLGLVHGR